MNKKNKLAMPIIALALLGTSNTAQAVDVPFVGAIGDSCTLIVTTAGILTVNSGGDVLSSKEAGGVNGVVTVSSTGPTYSVSIASPTDFTQIPFGTDGTSNFSSSYFMTGATNTGEIDETIATTLNAGISALHVDLEATKTSGVYPGGVYEAPVTVTCE